MQVELISFFLQVYSFSKKHQNCGFCAIKKQFSAKIHYISNSNCM